MMTLVRGCEGGQIIYQTRFGASWLCNVKEIEVTGRGFTVKLEPLRRVDTAMWQNYEPMSPFKAGAPWEWLQGGKHTLSCSGYVRFCITFDPAIVDQVKGLISQPKHSHGEILSLLRSTEAANWEQP